MIHTVRCTAGVLVLAMLGAPVLPAQASRGPVPVQVGLTSANSELRSASGATAELRRVVAADSFPQTRWLKGGIIGALVLGVPSALLWGELVKYSDQGNSGLGGYLAGFAVGGGLGFFIGALIGGQFEK